MKCGRCVYWIPRILSILFIAFLAMFSLDVIDAKASFMEIIIGLVIHNIPTIILLIIVIISWKYEIVGGIVFTLAGILYTVFTFEANIPLYIALGRILIIASPAFLIGILFMINWIKKRK